MKFMNMPTVPVVCCDSCLEPFVLTGDDANGANGAAAVDVVTVVSVEQIVAAGWLVSPAGDLTCPNCLCY